MHSRTASKISAKYEMNSDHELRNHSYDIHKLVCPKKKIQCFSADTYVNSFLLVLIKEKRKKKKPLRWKTIRLKSEDERLRNFDIKNAPLICLTIVCGNVIDGASYL